MSLLELFCFIQSIFSDKGALCAEKTRTLWNYIVSAGVATVYMRSIEEGIAKYLSTTPLLQKCLEDD